MDSNIYDILPLLRNLLQLVHGNQSHGERLGPQGIGNLAARAERTAMLRTALLVLNNLCDCFQYTSVDLCIQTVCDFRLSTVAAWWASLKQLNPGGFN